MSTPDTILILLAVVFFILGSVKLKAPVDWTPLAFAMLTLTLLV